MLSGVRISFLAASGDFLCVCGLRAATTQSTEDKDVSTDSTQCGSSQRVIEGPPLSGDIDIYQLIKMDSARFPHCKVN